jgi:hypothetical protein
MAAVIFARHHRNHESAEAITEQGTENFLENLPPEDVREFDVVLGTLLLGYFSLSS